MDPVATLALAREALVNYMIAEGDNDEVMMANHASELVDAFTALDEWMKRGGYSPWNKPLPIVELNERSKESLARALKGNP